MAVRPLQLMFLLAVLMPLFGQNQLTVEPTGCVYKAGDDPAWARTDFDDRGWSQSRPDLDRLPDSPYLWMRCRLDLRPLVKAGPPFIQVETAAAWQLFVDGELAGAFGDIETGFFSLDITQRRPLTGNTAEKKLAVIAIRRLGGRDSDQASVLRVQAGLERTLQSEALNSAAAGLANSSANFILSAMIAFAGVLLLILSGADRASRDIFWLGVACVSLGLARASDIALLLQLPQPVWVYNLWQESALSTYIASRTVFFFAVAGRHVPLFYRAVTGILVAMNLTWAFCFLWTDAAAAQRVSRLAASPPGSNLLFWLLMIAVHTAPIASLWPIWRVPKDQRLIRGLCFIWMTGNLFVSITSLPYFSGSQQVFAFNIQAIATSPAIIAMFFVLVNRQRRISEERRELQSEMKAAQEMQRMLVPAVLDVEPWLAVDVAYHPAKEVGGDFYFCSKTAEGQLIVVGDVSGKGLKAAMMASTLVGALRNEFLTEPAAVLAHLNAVAVNNHSGGFVTCLCALFRSNGTMRFANAGHLQPYCNGAELEAAAGLPLGIIAEAEYETATAAIAPGAMVTLISDGVVEADNGNLFGFDRTREISGKPASEIAAAAKAWGQNDDITVVTVRRTA